MKLRIFLLSNLIFTISFSVYSQSYRNDSELILENIMKGEEWMGTAPDDGYWSRDGEEIYFDWNPENELIDSDYAYNIKSGEIRRLTSGELRDRIPGYGLSFSDDKSLILYIKNGDLYIYSEKGNDSEKLVDLNDDISSAFFSADEEKIYFSSKNDLLSYTRGEGKIETLVSVKAGSPRTEKKESSNEQEEWLYNDQISLFDVLKKDTAKENLRKRRRKALESNLPYEIYSNDARIYSVNLTPDNSYVTFLKFSQNSTPKEADMPRFLTESGFTENEAVRSKVGYPYGSMQLGIYDIENDTIRYADLSSLPGIFTYTVFNEEQYTETRKEPRTVYLSSPVWSKDRKSAVINVRSTDNKDRWICKIDLDSASLISLDHQRDYAWIAGPGIGWSTSAGTLGWIDDYRIYFQSEESGYSHLYSYDLESDEKKQLTEGEFEIYDPFLSRDREYFFFTSNEEHYGERHFYRISVEGGERHRLTFMKGRNDVILSPDEDKMLIRYSYANKPWELYIADLNMRRSEKVEPVKITESYSDEFHNYKWKDPEFIRFKASDGEMVPARVYRPSEDKKNGAAIVFVHGAGYRQNAHKWWSNYYREYMFHNFLVDNGYTVLDIDFRASAGYGRDWRTAIYRHMGGKDLSDNIDGADYLIANEDIDPEKIGIYGGSYGGFITLMAQFTSPGIFKAGAALRPVTDWAHYNHGYTSNILNTPSEDSLAYYRSSPIYHAEGLKDHLLMCHGMVDDNVHFQDVVRLSQKLIELQKDRWELAIYPVEPHGFEEWTSWLDEYKRIYGLFEEVLLEER
ncbi:MAG: prolyl oligopeptidase family serine peptidase [Bacteroidota bacterium]